LADPRRVARVATLRQSGDTGERIQIMALYMYKVAYTAEAWAAMAKNPQNRTELITPVVEGAGGKIVGAWMAFGE
jgi:threonine synthase